MNWIILAAGLIGLAVAGYGFVILVVGAIRRKAYAEIVLAVTLVAMVVALLIAFGDNVLG